MIPGRPNDNCRVEQKNGSIIRAWLGEARLDDRALEPKLRELARLLRLYHNLFVPCRKLLAKTPKDRLHTSYAYRYDKPRTPAQRALESGVLTKGAERKIRETLANTNGVWPMELIGKRYRRLLALQAKLDGERDARSPFASADVPEGAARSAEAAEANGVRPPPLPTSAPISSAITRRAKASVSSS